MRIGFDAKRAFQNGTGLGHYSRTLIQSLARHYPMHAYYLFAPTITDRFNISSFNNIQTVSPHTLWDTFLKAAWRSSGVKNDLLQHKIDLYHGLSHEIPNGIQHTGISSVVTMHDLIFERYPHQYAIIDRLIYRKKFKYACRNADRIIAISEQTKKDLIKFYEVPEQKIDVCYQSCNPQFDTVVSLEEKEKIRKMYSLPKQFFLSVGSIIERKNLLSICKALLILKNNNNIPLVVIGDGGAYKKMVQQFIQSNHLQDSVIFLSDTAAARQNPGFTNSTDFPAIYQMAEALIYPSEFEGFGIPILEALFSGLPVITSNTSCMPEAGGDAALYIDPYDYKQMAVYMQAITTDSSLRLSCVEKGKMHAQKFKAEICAQEVMKVYESILYESKSRHSSSN